MGRILRSILALAALLCASSAGAQVHVTFHSFNGSIFFGRYPHTFVSLDGTLDKSGQVIHENYGWSAKHVSPAVLTGPVFGEILHEKDKWLEKTNSHFTVDVDDATYWRIREEVDSWANHPGKFYDLAHRNCIHFVGRIAEMVGLKVNYPHDLLRKPRAWLNEISQINPRLHAKPID